MLTSNITYHLLGRITVLRTYVLRPIVTNRVAWSVGLSSEPCKTAELIEMPLG